MNFDNSPVAPIVLNVPVNDYSTILTDFKFFDNPLFSHLSGKLLVGASMRYIKFGVDEGMVTSAEIIDIVAGDTFMDISLSQRAKAFYQSLLSGGLEAKMDKWGISLSNHPVGYFAEQPSSGLLDREGEDCINSLECLTMKLSPHCSLPLTLGGTTDQVASQCYEHEIIDNDFDTELEGFIDIENIEPGDEGRKIICRVENGRCVTVTMAYLDLPITDTFLGLDLNYGPNAKAQFLAGLRHQGVEVIAQSEYIILPNDFVTIELGESITWWDRAYWGTDGFRNEAIALQP